MNRRNKKNKYMLRRLLLTIEAVMISLFIIGGTDIKQFSELGKEVLAKENDTEVVSSLQEKENTQKVVSTPEFRWENYTVIAHALGAVDGKAYLNSKESFIENYEKGYRLFEVDLTETSDGVWVCRHSWNTSMGQWDGNEKKILTAEEFLKTPIYGKYTPMTLYDLFVLLKEYPDAFVMLDSKQYSIRNYQKTLEDYSEYVEIATEAGAEQVLCQLIPQIYNEAMYPGVALMQKFQTYIYSMWQEYSTKELEQIAEFCREKNIPAATIYENYWSPQVQEIFDEKGILLYIYTVNNLDNALAYLNSGAAGVCTDTITKEEIISKQ